MAILIQSLSWTLILGLGQGFVVYAALWLVLKLMPGTSARVKYHLSLSALTVLLAWFVGTWWQQFHLLLLTNELSFAAKGVDGATYQQQLHNNAFIDANGAYHSLLSPIKIIFPWLSAFYIVGLLLMLVRLSSGMLQLFSLRTSAITQPASIYTEMLTTLKSKLQFSGGVQLFISAKAQVPMVIGFFKPIILMPAATMAQLSMDQFETILLHELAHIKRYDYLVNILQTVVETILFFNPFVWLISAIIRREREHCCDDLVLDHTREPLFYATALAALATQPGTTSTFTVAASGQSNYLFNRIKRIMEMKKNSFSYSRMVAAILIITTITTSVVWLTPSFAKAKPTRKAAIKPNLTGSDLLISRLANDKLIDEVKGFVVEKKQNQLFIDGKLQTEVVATRYLADIKEPQLFVQVHPFIERLRQHPGSNLLQLIAPVTFSSPCVKKPTGKPGC